ncbi:lytic murein transglycosylase [Nocardia sp. 004]|uniref:lytic transglycosylase domain-containing protein n=1 Tax=Nocardia sp. 004 TaxID=3385978 RepID=UPI0039A3A04B
MRVSVPVTVSALLVAGVVASGSAPRTSQLVQSPETSASGTVARDTELSRIVGFLPVTAAGPRRLRAVTPLAGAVPVQDVTLPSTGSGALGIPEVVLAAYRNAELSLAASTPGCGLSWSLLAGIGRIESGHARGGRTDSTGTTVQPIYGPALDGSLPGNEIIPDDHGGYVRAMGPMQFLPSTWKMYEADGNGDGVADPHNVFDAALAAGKYLCSGGLNLRDPAQELRAVLRYNNSVAYAANVLSWSIAYRSGGAPVQVLIPPGAIPPGTASPTPRAPEAIIVDYSPPSTDPEQQEPTTEQPQPPAQVMITIPGLPPIPCGILCPAPPTWPGDPCVVQPVPAPMPGTNRPAIEYTPLASAQPYGATPTDIGGTTVNGQPGRHIAGCARPGAVPAPDPVLTQGTAPRTDPGPTTTPLEPETPAPPPEQATPATPATPPEQAPRLERSEPATPSDRPGSAAAPAQPEPIPQPLVPQPAITLPFGIVIPLPAPPRP